MIKLRLGVPQPKPGTTKPRLGIPSTRLGIDKFGVGCLVETHVKHQHTEPCNPTCLVAHDLLQMRYYEVGIGIGLPTSPHPLAPRPFEHLKALNKVRCDPTNKSAFVELVFFIF